MAGISLSEAQRELHNFAMDEMRNRGLNAALKVLQERISRSPDGMTMRELQKAFQEIARLRTDPGRHLSDWWAAHPVADPDCFYAEHDDAAQPHS